MRPQNAFGIGTPVRSHYRARWTGVVIGHEWYGSGLVLVVRITHDRRGRPVRRSEVKRYHWSWFTAV